MLLGKKYKKEKEIKITVLNKNRASRQCLGREPLEFSDFLYESEVVTQGVDIFSSFCDMMRPQERHREGAGNLRPLEHDWDGNPGSATSSWVTLGKLLDQIGAPFFSSLNWE